MCREAWAIEIATEAAWSSSIAGVGAVTAERSAVGAVLLKDRAQRSVFKLARDATLATNQASFPRTAFGTGLVLLTALSIGAGCAKKDPAQAQEPASAATTAASTPSAAAPVAPGVGGAAISSRRRAPVPRKRRRAPCRWQVRARKWPAKSAEGAAHVGGADPARRLLDRDLLGSGAQCALAGIGTRAPCSSATAPETRSMPSSTKNGKREAVKARACGRSGYGRTASPSTTARSTSPRGPGSRSSRTSRTSSTIRPSPQWSTDQLPNQQSHGWKFMRVGPDDKLYIKVGAPCKSAAAGRRQLPTIARMKPTAASSKCSRAACATRSASTGIPKTKELWFTDNGRDWLARRPARRRAEPRHQGGQHFGYPYCHQGNCSIREFG